MSTLSSAQTAIARSQLTVTPMRLEALQSCPNNPRRHGKRQIKQLARSIETFGFNVPVLVDAAHNVVAGEARLLAARELGLVEVPTICLAHLSDAQLKAFRIADNRLSELSSWDDTVLAETLRDLSLLNLDFSLDVTGFDMGEIDFRIESLSRPEPKADQLDHVPELPPGPPVSVPGDMWQLDRHRLLCGRALEADSYAKVMGGQVAAMVFSDPPYNVPIQGHVSGLGGVRHREFAMASGEMSGAEFTSFLGQALGLFAANSRDGSLHMICMDWRHLEELMAAARPVYAELKNLCVWAKDNAGMGSLYRSQHELVLVYKHGAAKHTNNVELGKHGRNRSNVWRYPGVNSFGRAGEEGNLLALHPTVKPVKMVADAILDCTDRGDIVLDGFLGSGTTLLAAERVGRCCRGLELDPLYVDTAVRRWQSLTGGTARHAVTGLTFDETLALGLPGGTVSQPQPATRSTKAGVRGPRASGRGARS